LLPALLWPGLIQAEAGKKHEPARSQAARFELAGHEFCLEEKNRACFLVVRKLQKRKAPPAEPATLALEMEAPCWFAENEASRKGSESRTEGWRVETNPGQPKAYAFFAKRSRRDPHYVFSVVAGSARAIPPQAMNKAILKRANGRCGSELRAVILHQGKVSLSARLPRGMYCAVPGPDLPTLWTLVFPRSPAAGAR
jgi:hypothetical protein